MQQKVKQLRVQIDGLAKLTSELTISDETVKAKESLLLGKAWLGKVLEALGVASPYPSDGNRHSLDDIEKTADTAVIETNPDWEARNPIERVDWLRQAIASMVTAVVTLDATHSREMAIARTNAYNHLSEARFWLGFQLERIKATAAVITSQVEEELNKAKDKVHNQTN